MLSAKYRIPKKEIPSVVRRGKKYSSDLFDIKVWFNDELNHPHFAVIISTKIDKRAVVRNTIKRKFKTAINSINTDTSNIFRKANYAFLIKNVSLRDMKSKEIEELIIKLLS